MRWHPPESFGKKERNKVWEVINLLRVTEQIFSDTTDGRDGGRFRARTERNVKEGKLQIKDEKFHCYELLFPWLHPSATSKRRSTSDSLGVPEAADASTSPEISLSLGKIRLPSSEKCCSRAYGLHVYYVCWKWTHFFWQLFLSLPFTIPST